MPHLQQLLNGLFDLILEFLSVPTGSGDYWFGSLLQLNSVLESLVGWSPLRYLPKYSVMFTQQCLDVHMMLMAATRRPLSSG